MEGKKHVIFSWGFNSRTGKLEMDSFCELVKTETVGGLFFRASITHYRVSLFIVPEEFDRDMLEEWVTNESIKEDVLRTLHKSIVNKEDIIRRRLSDSNAVDFIKCRA